MTYTASVSPIAPWIGGKRNLAKRLTGIIDQIACVTYVEPFVGMGGIFLRRNQRPQAEVINDRGREVANLFRILQRHYVAFLDMLRFQLTVRAEFNRLTAVDPETLTDLERAARFLYLQRTEVRRKGLWPELRRGSGAPWALQPDHTGAYAGGPAHPARGCHYRMPGLVGLHPAV